jgi:hypothetical protein
MKRQIEQCNKMPYIANAIVWSIVLILVTIIIIFKV